MLISWKRPAESKSWAGDCEETEGTVRMVIVCRWAGLEGIPAVQNETMGFELADDSTVRVDQHMELPIVSPHGVAWRDLGKIEIRIMRVGPRRGEEMNRDDNGADITAQTAPGATTMWVGTLCMSDMLPTRNGTSLLSLQHRAASIKLDPMDRAVAKARLDIAVGLLRRPQSSGWHKIFYTVSAKGASPFFARRLDSILEKVERNGDNFAHFICAKRLQNFKASKPFSSWGQGAYQQ
jgi:hypothetical protein